ncbi:MAG: glycosyltransferase involved in cell wall biosynthesis [Akkermansiaceae bacterium]|jgi:glycosyltransferase involved in cell wall biosynthesis
MDGKVSVVFPVGPNVKEAGLALDDLLNQTWKELEIVAILNGCLANVRDEFIGKSDPRLRVIDLGEQPQLLNALEVGVNRSSGKWLARMDSDDRCEVSRIERQVKSLLSGECEVVSCGIELVGGLGDGMQRYVDWVNALDSPEKVARERFVESPVVQPTVMMSKELLLSVGGYLRNGFAEDYDLWLRLLAAGARFGKVPGKLYQWHDRSDRLTRSDPRFGQKKMLELKAHALSRMGMIREEGVAISGAGPIGKVLGRELIARGIKVHGFFEVNPKRVGSTCQGAPIVGTEEFGQRWREATLLSAVGVSGGREKVRTLAKRERYWEGVDFWCCC